MKRINNKEKEVFEKSYQLVDMIESGMKEGKIDKEKIYQYFSDPKSADRFLTDLISEENFKSRSEQISHSFENRNTKKLLGKINQLKKQRTLRKIYIATGSVAAIFIALSLYLLGNMEQNVLHYSASNEIPTHSIVKPTIIVGNDKYIELDPEKDIVKSQSEAINNSIETQNSRCKLVVPSGFMYSIELSDGTVVTLNAGSTLQYQERFEGATREVEIQGEGYFKVAKADKPFIIKTNLGNIRVYGTEFNLKSDGVSRIETVLIRGSVGVEITGFDEVMMTPNQMITFDNDHKKMEIRNVNTNNYTQWKDNNFNYNNYSLESVLNDISSWYNVPIQCSETIKGLNITFFSKRDTNIEEIFNIVELGANVKFKKDERGGYRVER